MSLSKNPVHYMLMDGYSADDVMHACMSEDEYRGYWRGCVLKYAIRLGRKGDARNAALDAQKLFECSRVLAQCYDTETGDE